MATKRQIAANRRNAQKSTGPKTATGKTASSMNALRHGLRSRNAVTHIEDQGEFDRIRAGLQDEYQPQSPSEQYWVDQAAIAQWKLARAETYETMSHNDVESGADHIAILGRMTQIQGRLERSYHKAYKELERIKAARQEPLEQSAQPEEPKQSANPAGTAANQYRDGAPVNLRWIPSTVSADARLP